MVSIPEWYRKFQRERDKMNTPKYLEIAELLRIDIFVKHAKENQLIPGIRRYAQIYNVNPKIGLFWCGIWKYDNRRSYKKVGVLLWLDLKTRYKKALKFEIKWSNQRNKQRKYREMHSYLCYLP